MCCYNDTATTWSYTYWHTLSRHDALPFSFMLRHLADVDMKNDPKPAQDVIKLLEPMRQSWHELAKQNEAQAHAARAVPGRPAEPDPGDPRKKITVSA